MVAISSLLAGGGSLAKGVTGLVTDPAKKALNQSINISVGDIDVKQIIKYLLVLAIICAIVIFTIQFVRGLLLGVDITACKLGNVGCDWLGSTGDCNTCLDINQSSYNWNWDLEWWWRCLLYISLAGIIFLILYQWFMKIIHMLMRFDMYFKKIEDWIYGSSLEGEAERQISTRL